MRTTHATSAISSFILLLLAISPTRAADAPAAKEPVSVSGIYPHLAAFNMIEGGADAMRYGEAGIGCVVPWAGKLWYLTYPPHMTRGSEDKLYSIDPNGMKPTVHPESVGGTHAGRMIHAESKQLIMGPYFISEDGKVRVCDIQNALVGRMTAVMRHLTDPANKVYEYDMEGALYEVDVHTLAVTKLFQKPVPGWHGKGAYTGQGRLVVSNNGESGRKDHQEDFKVAMPEKPGPEDAGVLAEWDGKAWKVVMRRQFTDVTGPGDIKVNPDDKAPIWAVGWDKRSVILMCLDGGKWTRYRLPKGSHTFDPKHGYYTEWPRIREVAPGQWLMVMHGQMFQFPPTFSAANTAGIRAINTHLRYVPDLCGWNGKLVIAADDTSIMQNPLAGQSQSNLWFGEGEDLPTWGPAAAWGGVWIGDEVKANGASDPYLFAGYKSRVLHLSHRADHDVTFTVESDTNGKGKWETIEKITVPAESYAYHVFPATAPGEWIRLKPDSDVEVSAYFHYYNKRNEANDEAEVFRGFGERAKPHVNALVRPALKNRNLQVLIPADNGEPERYYEVDETLTFTPTEQPEEAKAIRPVWEIRPDVTADAASIILTEKSGNRWRLPRFDDQWDPKTQRGVREIQSERFASHWGGIFYEIPRGGGGKDGIDYQRLKPVSAHKFPIHDFCTWRGLLVVSGVHADAEAGPHVFKSADGKAALWFGAVDDLWKLGQPAGHGGPWLDTPVKAGEESDPFLMTNFETKRLTLRHTSDTPVKFTVEVNFSNTGIYRPYDEFDVPPGKEGHTHEFPAGYMAHWFRVITDVDTTATAQVVYE